MANPSLMVQQAIFRKTQPFPILCHALPTTTAIRTAKRLTGGIKQASIWHSQRLSTNQSPETAQSRYSYYPHTKWTDLCLIDWSLTLTCVLCLLMELKEHSSAFLLMFATQMFGEGGYFDILILTVDAFHGGFGTPRHMFLQHEERKFRIALVGTFDGDALIEVLEEGRLQVGTGLLAVVADRTGAGLTDYDGAALILEGLQCHLLAELAAEGRCDVYCVLDGRLHCLRIWIIINLRSSRGAKRGRVLSVDQS